MKQRLCMFCKRAVTLEELYTGVGGIYLRGNCSCGAVCTSDTDSLDEVLPHELPGQLRTAYRGVLTLVQAEEKIGPKYRVLELCPATCAGEDGDLVPGTEVIFALNPGERMEPFDVGSIAPMPDDDWEPS